MLGSVTIIVAHHMYAMPPYPYIVDYATLSIFTHHMWIGASASLVEQPTPPFLWCGITIQQ